MLSGAHHSAPILVILLVGGLLLAGWGAPSTNSSASTAGLDHMARGRSPSVIGTDAATIRMDAPPHRLLGPPGTIVENLTYAAPGPRFPYWPIGGVYDHGTGRIYSPENGLGSSKNLTYLLSATPATLSLNSTNLSLSAAADSIAYAGSNGLVYLGETDPATDRAEIQVFDPARGTTSAPVASSVVGTPGSMIYDPSNQILYIAIAHSPASPSPTGGLSAFDVSTDGFVTNGPALPAGFVPEVLTLTTNESTLYIGGFNTYDAPSAPLEVVAVNLSTNSVATISLPEYPGQDERPGSIAYDPTDDGVYFASSALGAAGHVTENVSVIDAGTNAYIASIAMPTVLGASTWAAGSITYNPENADLYLTQNPSPYFQATNASSNRSILVLNGTQLTSGNPSGSLEASMRPSGGIYVPSLPSGTGGELWFPSSPTNPASVDGGYSVLALPPRITSLAANPALIDEGMMTSIHSDTGGGGGNLTYNYTGLPTGCNSQDMANFTCTPNGNGSFTIRLEVTDALGQKTNLATQLVVDPPLAVTGTVSTDSPDVDQPVRFSATPIGGDAQYWIAWFFGDGAEVVSTTAVHSYVSAGTYAAYVLVNDSLGQVREYAISIAVSQVPSGATIVTNQSSTDVGIPVRFAAVVQNGSPPLSEFWGFDDGSANATAPVVAHTFQYAGAFLVTLRVTDGNGLIARSSLLFEVMPDLVGRILVSTGPLPVNASTDFAERLTGGTAPFRYVWLFGDNTTSTLASPAHAFTEEGNYSVSVRVTDAGGATVVNHTVVHVTAAPSTAPIGPNRANGGFTEDGYLLAIASAALGGVVGSAATRVWWQRRHSPPSPGENLAPE